MIKFKQKDFFAPIAALASLGGGSAAMGALNAAGAAGTVIGIKQGKDQMKQAEEQAAQAEEQSRKMTRALNKIAENAKNNPQAAQQAQEVMQQKQFARINFANLTATIKNSKTLGNAKGLAKDVGKIAWKRRNALIGGTMMGATMAGTSYLTDKAIQKDMKKNGMPLEKTYSTGSIMKAVKGTGKVLGQAAKKNKGTLITMAALGSAPMALGYSAEKAQYKDQVAATQRNYAVPGMMTVSRLAKSVKNAQIFKTPGKTILGGLSNLSGGGGRKGVYKFGHQLNRYGKHSGSVWSQKAGKFIMDNPKTALAGSIPVGAAVLGATWGTGEKIVNKTARALDKDAFKYQDSKNQEIQ